MRFTFLERMGVLCTCPQPFEIKLGTVLVLKPHVISQTIHLLFHGAGYLFLHSKPSHTEKTVNILSAKTKLVGGK